MLDMYQSVIQFQGIRGLFWSVMFPLSINSASCQLKFFISSLIFNILSRKSLTERRFGRQSLQYMYSNMSKNRENRWFGY